MLRQLLIVTAVFLAARLGLPALGLPMAGPVAVAAAAIVAVLCVVRAGEGWPALGLGRPSSPFRTAGVALGLAVLGYAAAIIATLVATQALGWPPMQSTKLAFVQGSLPSLLGMLAIAWTTAALGEELLFRGFLQCRLQRMLGGGRGAGLLAVALQALVFGAAHAYQGPTGILVTGSLGLVLGLAYLRTRSLWPLVFAHGLIDTVGLLALYAGKMPAQ